MDAEKKTKFLNEIALIKGLIPTAAAHASSLEQTSFHATGPMITIHTLPAAAKAIKAQGDCLSKLTNLVEKLLDEM